ncbi:hypothetical protein ACFL23_01300 [Patescibacteria group bacterium]
MNFKKNIILFLVISFAGLLAIIFFVILPTTKKIKDISKKIYDLRIDVEKKYVSGQNLRHTIKKFKEFKKSSLNLSNIYVEKNQELKFIESLENIALNNDLKQKINIKEAIISEDNPNIGIKNIQTMNLNVSLEGDYTNILKFLYDIRKLSYCINIESIIITKFDNIRDSKINLDKKFVNAVISADFYINNPEYNN